MIVAALCAVTFAISEASAADRWSGWKPYESRYLSLYEKAAKADLDVGANRVDDALPDRLRRAQVERLSGRLDAWLHPAPASAGTESAPAPTAWDTGATSGSCPAEMAAEATSPDAVNPTSGAFGCWQTLPQHYQPGGLCESTGTDYAGQQACVANICASQGNGAWSASGATPC